MCPCRNRRQAPAPQAHRAHRGASCGQPRPYPRQDPFPRRERVRSPDMSIPACLRALVCFSRRSTASLSSISASVPFHTRPRKRVAPPHFAARLYDNLTRGAGIARVFSPASLAMGWRMKIPSTMPRVDDQRVIGGIIFVIRNGLGWRDVPASYGPHKTIYKRFIRWREMDVLVCAYPPPSKVLP